MGLTEEDMGQTSSYFKGCAVSSLQYLKGPNKKTFLSWLVAMRASLFMCMKCCVWKSSVVKKWQQRVPDISYLGFLYV